MGTQFMRSSERVDLGLTSFNNGIDGDWLRRKASAGNCGGACARVGADEWIWRQKRDRTCSNCRSELFDPIKWWADGNERVEWRVERPELLTEGPVCDGPFLNGLMDFVADVAQYVKCRLESAVFVSSESLNNLVLQIAEGPLVVLRDALNTRGADSRVEHLFPREAYSWKTRIIT